MRLLQFESPINFLMEHHDYNFDIQIEIKEDSKRLILLKCGIFSEKHPRRLVNKIKFRLIGVLPLEFLVYRALRRFATLTDEVQYRKSMYGQVSPTCESSVAVRQGSNKVGDSNGYTNGKGNQRKRSSIITPLSRILPDRLLKNNKGDQRKQFVNLNNTGNLKVAFSEFYLMLILLQKYQLLNFTGFRKILKKHDKLFQTNRGEEWRYVFLFFCEI